MQPLGLGDPQKTCIFRALGAAVNHHSVAASFRHSVVESKLKYILAVVDTVVCGVCRNAERDQSAGVSNALPAYSFDNIGSASAAATLDSSLSAAAVNSGRYIQDDLPVLMPDGTSLPLSSLTADGSVFAFPGIADGKALALSLIHI